ncbi:unnamed protein product [Kuraishia capsulata CBS 1993]|uniref:Uncharacterized protein n=1 Tax=Kuraishia capsulata CBS 1993 TaxID=1382522 RepID=W6MQX8_9ASCO|nr:uncharacterized protein KUCA_T00004748001 [Kuraishia capsulata CBS 1993]CDK28763.1 unnamed protein product [Kuraishia capsulata CBS 1993]
MTVADTAPKRFTSTLNSSRLMEVVSSETTCQLKLLTRSGMRLLYILEKRTG